MVRSLRPDLPLLSRAAATLLALLPRQHGATAHMFTHESAPEIILISGADSSLTSDFPDVYNVTVVSSC